MKKRLKTVNMFLKRKKVVNTIKRKSIMLVKKMNLILMQSE